jgi:hypothetical protein
MISRELSKSMEVKDIPKGKLEMAVVVDELVVPQVW